MPRMWEIVREMIEYPLVHVLRRVICVVTRASREETMTSGHGSTKGGHDYWLTSTELPQQSVNPITGPCTRQRLVKGESRKG